MSEVQELFEVTPKQQLATYAVTRVASDPVVIEQFERLNGMIIQYGRIPLEINEADVYVRVGDLYKLMYGCLKKIDDHRKGSTGPVDRALKAVNRYFREAGVDEANECLVGMKARMSDYARRENQARQEAARKAAEAAEREALEAAARLEAGGHEAAAEAVVDQAIETSQAEEAAAKVGPARGDHGSTTSTRKVWKWKVIDKWKVPMEYLTVDQVLVNEAVRHGAREIPGLEIYQDVQVAVR
jgi:hypothetical protein